jgi:O-antigen ligase
VVTRVPLRVVAIGWIAGGIVQSVFAVWQFFVQYIPAQKWLGLAVHAANIPGAIVLQTDTERWLRAYGSFPHPNILGGYLVIALLCCLYFSYLYSSLRSRVILSFSIGILMSGLFFTFSRSAWVALVIALLWFLIYALRHRDARLLIPVMRFVVVGGLIGASLVYMYWPLVNSRVTIDSYLEYASLRERVVYIDQALTLISRQPIIGQGIGNYTAGVYTQINSQIPGWLYQPVHNVFLLVWAELGVIGAILCITLLGSLVIKNMRIMNLPSVFNLASLTTIIVVSFFDHYWWTLYPGMSLFWVIIGLTMTHFSEKG